VLVNNVLAMKFEGRTDEANNRLALDGNEASAIKIGDIKASMTEVRTVPLYLPPAALSLTLSELTGETLVSFKRDVITHNGYQLHGVKRQMSIGVKPLADYSLPEITWNNLDKIRLLCKETR
jgi:hypothetical protein